MPVSQLIESGSEERFKILIWEVSESEEELLSLLTLTDPELDTYKKIISDKRKREFLAIRIAINKLLKTKVNISYHLNGKPFLSDDCYRISISHSGKWVAVMAHPVSDVGIDIECPGNKIERVFARFLSLQEQNDLYKEKDVRKLSIAWSAKECLYKIIGNQAVDFQNQLQILPFEVQSEGTIEAIHLPTKNKYTLTYFITTAYTLVYCIDTI